jgi:thiol:disulfide interchange protein
MIVMRKLLSVLATLLVFASILVAAPADGGQLVKASLVADTTAVEPGKPLRVGVRMVMEPGWHTYWKDPGDSGLATAVDWKLPKGFSAGDLGWPAPLQVIEPGNIKANAYVGETMLTTVITPSKKISEKQITIRARVDWLVCEKICLPGGAEVELTLPVGTASPANEALFKKYPPGGEPVAVKHLEPTPMSVAVAPGFLAVLFSAVLGGLILNIMPCVLPVISLKIFSFVSEAHNDPKKIFRLGLVFALGILVSFWILAAVVVALKSAGQQIGWGFQLQSPTFVIIMSVIVMVFGLNLFGVFELYAPTCVCDEAGAIAGKSGYPGAFFNGFLATALATPCTAPFLGPALGYAFSRSALEVFTVFTAVALGLALPYLLLTARPAWLRHLPKPGPWMERTKQFMGFLLVATLLWLLWVLGSLLGFKAIIWAGAFLLLAAIACWILGQFATPLSSRPQRTVAWLVALALTIGGWAWFVPKALGTQQHDGIAWVTFSPEELERTLARRQTVFLDFTAEWCLTCKVNEHTILESEEVVATLRQLKVVPMKADWTRYDPEITAMLARFDRSGVPLYVIFPGKDSQHPIVLPEVITRGLVVEKLEQAAGE